MGREADANEPLLRRARRVFATEERSLRMDRRSPAAVALRAVVADILPRFLGICSDDTLAVSYLPSPPTAPPFSCAQALEFHGLTQPCQRVGCSFWVREWVAGITQDGFRWASRIVLRDLGGYK